MKSEPRTINSSLLLFRGLGLVRSVLGWPDSRPNGASLSYTNSNLTLASQRREQQESRRAFLGYVRSKTCPDSTVAKVTYFYNVLHRVSRISDAEFKISPVRFEPTSSKRVNETIYPYMCISKCQAQMGTMLSV